MFERIILENIPFEFGKTNEGRSDSFWRKIFRLISEYK
jgi:hypothetical protein